MQLNLIGNGLYLHIIMNKCYIYKSIFLENPGVCSMIACLNFSARCRCLLAAMVSCQMLLAENESVSVSDTTAVQPDTLFFQGMPVPENACLPLEMVSVKNTPLKDVFRSLATKYNLNIFVDDAISQQITVRLTDISVHEAVEFLASEYDLLLSLKGTIYKVRMPEPVKPEPKPLNIRYKNNRLTLDIHSEPLDKVIYTIQEKTGKNIILNRGVDGRVTGFLQDVAFESGLSTLLKSNGFVMRTKEDIYIIDRDGRTRAGETGEQKSFWVDVQDSLLYVEVIEGELNIIIQEAAGAMGINVIMLSPISGKLSARFNGLTFDRMLDYLFKGTDFTYRKDGDVYLLGDKKISGMASIRLIKLGHLKAEGIIEQLPADLTSKATLQVIKEHNAVMAVGSQDVIREVEEFIHQIDYPIPQVLIEAIVVDFNTTDLRELSINAWRETADDTSGNVFSQLLFPALDVTATGGFLNKSIQYNGPRFNITNIGKLPEDFLLQLRALEQKKKVNIKSNPQIATLNGHSASIKIGSTQYYKLQTQTPYVGGNNVINPITERFQEIKAEISLEITPWVSASGEITTEIKPSFSTPKGGFNSETLPTIDHRNLESTVRLRDGETIVLGGLIQETDEKTISKFPVLGDIPFLGQLFKNRNYNKTKAQLMIYITPHLMYSGMSMPYRESSIR